MKNLVMGAAKSYGWEVLEPFVLSCKMNCPSAELVLIVDDISDFTRDRLTRHGVTLIDIPADYKDILVVNSRFKLYADFLEQFGANYSQVFLADTRDVIFQADVFAKFGGLTNWLGYATESDDIGGTKTDNDTNYNWLVNCFGQKIADSLCDKKIICAGTIIGTVAEMEIFCRIMWYMVKHHLEDNFDQAIMNYLVWNGRLPIENLIELDNDGGEVFTMELAKNFFVRDKKILRGNGTIPAVVHQYDRHEHTMWLVDKVYHAKNFQVDNRFNDTRSIIEQATSLIHAGNVDEAAEFFIGELFITEDFSEYISPLLRLWEIALRQRLTKESGDIELAVQCVLKITDPIPFKHLAKIISIIKLAREGNHRVDEEFADLLTEALTKAAQQAFAANENERYQFCVNLLKNLGVNYSAR